MAFDLAMIAQAGKVGEFVERLEQKLDYLVASNRRIESFLATMQKRQREGEECGSLPKSG